MVNWPDTGPDNRARHMRARQIRYGRETRDRTQIIGLYDDDLADVLRAYDTENLTKPKVNWLATIYNCNARLPFVRLD